MAGSKVMYHIFICIILLDVTPCIYSTQNINILSKQLKPECHLEVDQCEVLNSTVCLGATLPYRLTSHVLADDSENEAQILEKLGLWAGLRNVPKCWEVIQPFLCAVYMPRCYNNGNVSYIVLPSVELCEQTRKPCKVVETYSGWPDFLQCNNTNFPSGCSIGNPVVSLKYNTTGTCERPLVKTSNPKSWYEDVDGCGVQCENPMFTEEEHRKVHVFIAVFGSLCMACTLFTVLSFIIDWKNASRYPALILFFINACFFVGSVGWMAQFMPGARTDIVCRADGTMRTAEPQMGSGETSSCTVVFILVYYFMIAGITWFVILAYAWHLIFKSLDYPRDAIEGKRGHFHLVAWSFPLVLTIVCLALSQVDGDSVSGICFVGYLNHTYRGFFVLLPVGIVLCVGSGFLISGLVTLVKMKMVTPGLISDKASAKIRETIIRLGIFTSFAVIFVMVTFFVHAYIFTNEPLWKKSFEDYIICEANVTVAKSLTNRTTTCKMASRPNLVATEIHIFAYFGAGIAMSSWVWNKATLETWRRFLRKKFLNKEDEKPPVRLRKHEVIARAFSKRHDMNDGRISLSFYSTHDDPIGMKFDVNSISSLEMSSAWAAAIPRMITRRGAMAVPNTRRYSDSDVQSVQSTSFGACGMTVGSQSPRRNSMQSHGSHSLSHSEQEDTTRRKKKKHRRRLRGANRIAPMNPNSIMPGSDQRSKAESIEPMSSAVPSSQCSRCTSMISTSTDQQCKTDVVTAEVHDADNISDAGNDINDGYHAADSDSFHSEDSIFTVQPDMLENDNMAVQDDGNDDHDGDDGAEEGEDDSERLGLIPSKKSAFKKYHRCTAPASSNNNNVTHQSEPAQAQNEPNVYTMGGTLGYLPQNIMPDYVAPQPRYPPMLPMMYPGSPPDVYPGYFPPPHAYSMNNYPMTFMPQDFFVPSHGFMPYGVGFYPHPMSPMSPPYMSYPYPPPGPVYSPYDASPIQLPQKVEPVPYHSTKKTQPSTKPEAAIVTEVEFPMKSKRYKDGGSVNKAMSFENPAFERPSPTIKTRDMILNALDGRHYADLKPSLGSPKFSSSSTYHLDRVELDSASEQSV